MFKACLSQKDSRQIKAACVGCHAEFHDVWAPCQEEVLVAASPTQEHEEVTLGGRGASSYPVQLSLTFFLPFTAIIKDGAINLVKINK